MVNELMIRLLLMSLCSILLQFVFMNACVDRIMNEIEWNKTVIGRKLTVLR